MWTHIPKKHPEFWKEKWEGLSWKEKDLVWRVRRAVWSLTDNELASSANTLKIKKNVKGRIWKELNWEFLDTNNPITKALIIQWEQYRYISWDRFFHRLKNKKFKRDATFLLRMVQYMGQYSPEVTSTIVGLLFSDIAYPTLKNSPSIRSLSYMIDAIKKYMKEKEQRLIREKLLQIVQK